MAPSTQCPVETLATGASHPPRRPPGHPASWNPIWSCHLTWSISKPHRIASPHQWIRLNKCICKCHQMSINSWEGWKPCPSKSIQDILPNHSHKSRTFAIGLALQPRSNPMNGCNNHSQHQASTELPERHWCTKYNPPHRCRSVGRFRQLQFKEISYVLFREKEHPGSKHKLSMNINK